MVVGLVVLGVDVIGVLVVLGADAVVVLVAFGTELVEMTLLGMTLPEMTLGSEVSLEDVVVLVVEELDGAGKNVLVVGLNDDGLEVDVDLGVDVVAGLELMTLAGEAVLDERENNEFAPYVT